MKITAEQIIRAFRQAMQEERNGSGTVAHTERGTRFSFEDAHVERVAEILTKDVERGIVGR